MKVVIIEDEKLSADHLELLIRKLDIEITIVDKLDTVKSAIRAFEAGLICDLIFIDIHLADGNSFEIFNRIEIKTPLIFTTAYDNYAIQAFKQNSIDYMLKPISFDDLSNAIHKFKRNQQIIDRQMFDSFTRAYRQFNGPYKERFIVKTGENIEVVHSSDIHHLESKDSLTFLITHKGKKYIIDYTLEQLEKILLPSDFFRINRKTIIHIQSIDKVRTFLNNRLTVSSKYLDTESNVVSRERVPDFKKWLDN